MANSITKCPKCIKIVYDNANSICCDDCDNWFHLRCTQLKLKDFKEFTNNPKLNFYCNFCVNYKCLKCDKPVFDHKKCNPM